MSTFDQILTDATLGRLFGTQVEAARAAERQRLNALTPLPRRMDVPCACGGGTGCMQRFFNGIVWGMP